MGHAVDPDGAMACHDGKNGFACCAPRSPLMLCVENRAEDHSENGGGEVPQADGCMLIVHFLRVHTRIAGWQTKEVGFGKR